MINTQINFFILSALFFLLSISIEPLSAQQNHQYDDAHASKNSEIGDIHFNVSCEENVQEDFNYALGMLHHMMYASSRELFNEILEKDPGCAMAHWGVATTLFQPLWGTRPSDEDLQMGWSHIKKAVSEDVTESERLLIGATEHFFRDPESAEFRTRINRWTDALDAAFETSPGSQDIAAFYGLSLITRAQFTDSPTPLLDEAETILRDVFNQNNAHPGAIHYTIHATDADGRGNNALEIVEAYSKIAPQVPHALHMPSHIYVRLGDWPSVVRWNLRSAEAALQHPVDGAESHHYIHAIDYLVYAYLQRGEDRKAEEAYEEALAKERFQASFISTFHFAATPARLAVEQRDWQRAANITPRSPGYLPWDESPWAEAITWFARGLGAAHTGDSNRAKEAEAKMKTLQQTATERGDINMAAYISADRYVLSGRIAYAEGETGRALTLTRKATEIEQSIEKHPVTPGAILPTNEALGDLLMDLNRPADALRAYEKSNQLWPGRLNTLMGAALAAKMEGEQNLHRRFVEALIKHGATNLDPQQNDLRNFVQN